MKKIKTENESALAIAIFNELRNWYIANSRCLKNLNLENLVVQDDTLYLINATDATDIIIGKFLIVPIKSYCGIDVIDAEKLKNIDSEIIINIGLRYNEVNGNDSFKDNPNRYLSIIDGLYSLMSTNGESWVTKKEESINDIAADVLTEV